MKLIKVINKRGEERKLERPVAENMVRMFPNDWKLVEEPLKEPKKKRDNKEETK